MNTRIAAVAVAAGLLALANQAQAHIKLLKPASAVQENSSGGPQKDSPCGPGPTEGQGMASNQVTTFMEGEEITVDWTETVPHNGHFRIALAKDPSEFKDPKVTGTCQSAEIQDPPVLPILADGLFPSTSDDGKRDFSQKVKLPAGFTCDKCTLQLIQFMTPHPNPCFYYHCANIKIVAAGAAAGGGGAGQATAGASAAVSGQGGAAPAVGGAGGSVIVMMGAAGSGGIHGSAGASGPSVAAPAAAGSMGATTPTAPTASAGRPATSAAGSSAPTGTASMANGVTAAPATPTSGGGCSTTRAHAGGGTIAGCLLLGFSFAMRRRRVRSS